jgi:hypothetical protein
MNRATYAGAVLPSSFVTLVWERRTRWSSVRMYDFWDGVESRKT